MALSPADVAFQQALHKFEETLNSDEFEDIQRPTSLDDLLDTARQIVEKHEQTKNRKLIKFYRRLSTVREGLRPFDQLLEGICGIAPQGGKALWGVVSFVFRLIEDRQSSFETAFDFVFEIAQRIPVVQSLEKTFGDSALVKPYVENLFVVLVSFWVQAIKTYRKPGYLPFKATFSLKSRFEQLKKDLSIQTSLLNAATSAQHYEDSDAVKKQYEQHHRGKCGSSEGYHSR